MLFLTLATFSQTGGVQMVCRSLTKALNNISIQDSTAFQMISLCDATADVDANYIRPELFKAFNYNRLQFCMYAFWKACSSKTVILAHFNLLPLAYIIKLFSPTTSVTLLVHGKEVWGNMPGWKRSLLNRKVRIWAVSRFTKKVLAEKHQVNAERIGVLNNCLDPLFKIPTQFTQPDYLLKRYHFNEANQIILTLTRLDQFEKDKGYDLVLDCLPVLVHTFPDIRYLIAGKATEAEGIRINAKVRKLNLQRHVILTGFVQAGELADHHLLSDLFVLPSSKEGFGLVFLEAAACGTNIIAGNRDGSCDAVLDGLLGQLVDPCSKDEITAAIKQLLSKPRDPVVQKRQQATCITSFSFPKYQQNVHSLLNRAR